MSVQWQEDLVALAEAAAQASIAAAGFVAVVAVRPVNALHSVPVVNNITPSVIAAENVSRRQLIVHNPTGGITYLKFGLGCTTTAFTLRLTANETYSGPLNGYAGVVTAIRASGTGTLQVTEVTE